MIPGCSWWNPQLSKRLISYVLEHEQIHFGIAELTARRLTARIREEIGSRLFINGTYKETQDEFVRAVNGLLEEEKNESLKTHIAFDEDTSIFHDPKRQLWWKEKINSELKSL